jgi:hypothetical protein
MVGQRRAPGAALFSDEHAKADLPHDRRDRQKRPTLPLDRIHA